MTFKFFEYFPTHNSKAANGISFVDIFNDYYITEQAKNSSDYFDEYQVIQGETPQIVSKKLYGNENEYWTFMLLNPHLKNLWFDWMLNQEELEDYLEKKYPYYVTITEDDISTFANVGDVFIGLSTNSRAILIGKREDLGQLVFEFQNENRKFRNGEIIYGESTTASSIRVGRTIPHYDAPHHYEDENGDYVFFDLFNQNPPNINSVSYKEYEEKLNDERGQIKVIKPIHLRYLKNQYIDAVKENV